MTVTTIRDLAAKDTEYEAELVRLSAEADRTGIYARTTTVASR